MSENRASRRDPSSEEKSMSRLAMTFLDGSLNSSDHDRRVIQKDSYQPSPSSVPRAHVQGLSQSPAPWDVYPRLLQMQTHVWAP